MNPSFSFKIPGFLLQSLRWGSLNFLIYALGRKGGINNAFGQNRFLINLIRDKGEWRDGGFIIFVGAYFDILEVGDRKRVCFERNILW